MMEPPVTNSPENTLTPSRCALESRPFLELPKPFLCAITNPCLYFPVLFLLAFAGGFLGLVLFLAAFGLLLDLPLADFAAAAAPSVPSASASFAFLGLRAGRSGAVKRS